MIQCVDCKVLIPVEDWYEHDNDRDCYPAKRFWVLVSLGAIGWLVGALALVGALTIHDRVFDPQEDDLIANCHILGDGQCGPGTPWHGFVNF